MLKKLAIIWIIIVTNFILRQTPPGATVATCDLIVIGLSAVT